MEHSLRSRDGSEKQPRIGQLRGHSLPNLRRRQRPPTTTRKKRTKKAYRDAKHTAAGIPAWSPTVVLICRSTAYVWQSGRDAQFSADCG
ncbi:hypothetical protein KCU77_g1034, partial [Aureobasidium melanogenum]